MATKPTTFGKRAPDGAWEVPILGDIGFFGVDGAELIRELSAVKPQAVRFIIYSPGGAVYDAIAAAGWILEQGIECYAEIYGYCASAATVFAALAGPKNTAIAPGSMFLVHMPYGGDQKAIDNAAAFLQDLYAKAYGWSKSEARKHMEAENGQGILWNTTEAKKNGVVGEIMEGAKVAARHNLNTTAMADTKRTVKVQAKVKLTTMDAARAAFSAEGTTAEVEVDLEQAAAEAIAGHEAAIADLKRQIAEADAKKQAEEAAGQEALTQANKELVTAKADLAAKDTAIAQAKADSEKVIADLKAAHAAEIADLKKPLAKGTIADNQEPASTGASDKDQDPADKVLDSIVKNLSPMEKSRMEIAARRKEKK